MSTTHQEVSTVHRMASQFTRKVNKAIVFTEFSAKAHNAAR